MDIPNKFIMWKTELEKQDATQGQMHVFDSMMAELGELDRKNAELEIKVLGYKSNWEKCVASLNPVDDK